MILAELEAVAKLCHGALFVHTYLAGPSKHVVLVEMLLTNAWYWIVYTILYSLFCVLLVLCLFFVFPPGSRKKKKLSDNNGH